MEKAIKQAIDQKKWAVVGARTNEETVGFKLVKRLKQLGKEVYPISPKYDEICGIKAYKSLEEVIDQVDAVDICVNKTIGQSLLDSQILKKVDYVWFQHKTWTEEMIEEAKGQCEHVIYDVCLLEETDYLVPEEDRMHKKDC